MLLRYDNNDTPLDEAEVCVFIDSCYDEIVRILNALEIFLNDMRYRAYKFTFYLLTEVYVPVCRRRWIQ